MPRRLSRTGGWPPASARFAARVGIGARALHAAYTLGVRLAAPLVAWRATRQGKWPQENIDQRWGRSLPAAPTCRPIWIHAASMGEVRVGAYFAAAAPFEGEAIVASAMTETGFELSRPLYPEGTACFRLPFDLPDVTERVLSHFRPRALVLVETEWWPNLLLTAAAHGIPVYVVNGRLAARAEWRYRVTAFYWRAILRGVVHFYMRSAPDAARLTALGIDPARVSAAGNLKATMVGLSEDPSSDSASPDAGEAAPIWIAGCTRPGEEPVILEAYRMLCAEYGPVRLWLAPRHPERFADVARLIQRAGYPFTRWSEQANASPGASGAANVMLIDQMGALAHLYTHAAVAFVGGSLRPFGGHNPLEPALAGAEVVFGPYMGEQQDAATMLLESGVAHQVEDARSLATTVAATLRARPSPTVRRQRADELRDRLLRIRQQVAADLMQRLTASGGTDSDLS